MPVTYRTREREQCSCWLYVKMKRFKYNVIKLIEAIKERPCLWNRNAENYKDRVDRKQAWNEIFAILDERYEGMSSTDKRLTSEIILTKWTNIRDTFVKTLRKKGRKGKHYILHDHLTFLLPFLPESNQDHDNLGYDHQPTEETHKDDSRKSIEFDTYEHSDAFSDIEVTPYKASCSKRKRMKKESVEEIESPKEENIDFVSVDDPRIMNEDEAFFASLLPTVVKYSEDERLEFRIEVLSLMKRINDKRKWACVVTDSK